MERNERKLGMQIFALMTAAAVLAGAFSAELVPDNPTEAEAAKIKKKKAKKIALKDAGVDRSQIRAITCEKDWEDGQKVFEISIYMSDGGEYEYVISVATGSILEKEYDND